MLQHPPLTIASDLWPVSRGNALWRSATLAFVGSLLLIVSAKITIPFYPVPLTMQTLVVLCLGMAYGWRLAGMTVLLYLLEGMAGLPVFAGTPAKGIGLSYMLGGTGGYLVGFLFAAMLCGYLGERGWDRSIGGTFAAMVLSNMLIYALGISWLIILFGIDKPILQWGLIPFIPGDLLKIALACGILPGIWKLRQRNQS